jgi:hypothetical protein
MITWINLKVEDKFHITGRGDVVVVNLKENNIVTENWLENIPIEIGHVLVYEGEDYKVVGVETTRDVLRGYLNTTVGVLIKKIVNEET